MCTHVGCASTNWRGTATPKHIEFPMLHKRLKTWQKNIIIINTITVCIAEIYFYVAENSLGWAVKERRAGANLTGAVTGQQGSFGRKDNLASAAGFVCEETQFLSCNKDSTYALSYNCWLNSWRCNLQFSIWIIKVSLLKNNGLMPVFFFFLYLVSTSRGKSVVNQHDCDFSQVQIIQTF